MLASMHAAKSRKEAELQLKLQAQKEAKERAEKAKAQRDEHKFLPFPQFQMKRKNISLLFNLLLGLTRHRPHAKPS